MSQEIQKNEAELISSLVINGDLSKLTQTQKVSYYKQFCDRLGLDPLSQPFKLLRLNGKEVMYCDRSGAQQLNKIHKVSHTIKAREVVNECYIVTAQASTPDGRHTESIGAVNISGLKGDNLCNAMMKGETKAKRRATLDLLGLGMLDETEVETIPQEHEKPKLQHTGIELVPGMKEWEEAKNYLRGGGTIPAIQLKYNISDANKEKIIDEVMCLPDEEILNPNS